MNRSLKFKAFAYCSSILALIALSCSLAFGQAISGNLTGTVLDPSGAAVNGATVQAVNVDTGQKVTTQTRAQGDYLFSNLPVGAYNITATAQGFKTTTLSRVPVELNKVGTANVRLEVGSSSTTVEVSGITPPVDTSTAQMQTNYNNLYAEDLGITSAGGTGAGVLNLSLLSPGVTQASALGLGTGPSVGGQRPRDNNFTVEGVDNNNKSVTGALISVPNDATESFTLLQNQFNSEFGHSSGGQFNTTIKSGTNGFHGSVYEYFRNRNLNAVDNTYVIQGLTENPRFDSNRYGGTIGGPIVKNKLFFFTNFERQPVGLTGTSGTAVFAPTAAGVAAIQADPNVNPNNLGILEKYLPPPSTPTGCIQYDTNARPNEAQQVGSFTAPANGTCAAGNVEIGQITVAAPAWENFENFVQSVDFNASSKDQLRGRYVFNKLDEIDTNASLPAFYLVQPFRWYLFTLGEYHTFTPAVLNEFRIGFNRYSNTTPAGNFSYPSLNTFPNVLLNDLGGVNIGPDPNAPQFTIQNLYQAVDNVTWTKGAHAFKFGGEWREYISPQSFTQRQRGDYEYNSTQMFLEDFTPDIIGERSSGSVTYYGNQSALYWYANDNWKATSHLALNLGIRYEYTTIPTGENLNALNSISNTPSIIVGGVNEPLIFQKPQAPKNNWAPRIGIAYSPGTSGDTSIRAGFGMAYDVLYDNIGILAVPPQVGATNDVPSLATPSGGFFAGGALPGGGTGVSVLSATDARSGTSNWIPPQTKWPYSENWNLGVQHSFGKDYSVEVRYVGTRGVHLDVQSRIDRRSLVSPQAFLPTYLQQPSQATLDALPNTLDTLSAPGSLIPAFANAGFARSMTADVPLGWSMYHGLQTQLIRTFSNGLQFQASYTFSRTIDNSTADFFSTSLTPRRAQDFQNMDGEKSVSPLSRTHRLTIAAVYEMPFFKNGNWLMKNIVGNWGFSPIYTYESPEWADVQSANDANLNGDSAGDRAIINPGGVPGTGSGVTALCNITADCSAPNSAVVAYLATNPTAQYIAAGSGALATGGRNTLATRPTNDFDLSIFKNVNITERVKFKFGAQFSNLLNHAQLIPGSNPGQGLGVNDVASFNTTSGSYLNYLTPGDPNFNNPKSVFASNARTIGLVAKIVF